MEKIVEEIAPGVVIGYREWRLLTLRSGDNAQEFAVLADRLVKVGGVKVGTHVDVEAVPFVPEHPVRRYAALQISSITKR